MKLIKKIGTRYNKTGNRKRSWGLFRCPSCRKKVEKVLGDGKGCLSCGCSRGENIAKSNIGISRNKGKNHPQWKGGRYKNSEGYVIIYQPDHPRSDSKGYVCEAYLIMEAKIKRFLKPAEIVHHRNGIRDDNRIENLRLFKTVGKHISYHHRKENKLKAQLINLFTLALNII